MGNTQDCQELVTSSYTVDIQDNDPKATEKKRIRDTWNKMGTDFEIDILLSLYDNCNMLAWHACRIGAFWKSDRILFAISHYNFRKTASKVVTWMCRDIWDDIDKSSDFKTYVASLINKEMDIDIETKLKLIFVITQYCNIQFLEGRCKYPDRPCLFDDIHRTKKRLNERRTNYCAAFNMEKGRNHWIYRYDV